MAKHIKSSFGFDGIIKPFAHDKKSKLILNEVKDIDIDFKTQKLVSFSQFQLYHQCPHKWSQQYVYKNFKTPPSIHLIFGTAIHEIFQNYLTVGFNKSFAAADRINIEEELLIKLRSAYNEMVINNNNKHFSTPAELGEFYQDGLDIMNWFKKKRSGYFTSRGYQLLGIEMPLHKNMRDNVIYRGYIDLVVYDEFLDKITIYDIKTSTKGWSDWDKKNDSKLAQLLIYKQYFSELYGFPVDNIDVQFFILKRKAEPNEFVEFPKRIQTFTPANGKNKINQAVGKFEEFVVDCFDETGQHIYKDYPKNRTKLCDWCPINNTSFCLKD